MKEIVKGVAADLFSAVNFSTGGSLVGVGSTLLNSLIENRREVARKIAISEISRCGRSKLDVINSDEFVPIVFRYGRAAIEGTASHNLKLMAKLMRGQIVTESVFASEFLEFADVISTLKLREIAYLSKLVQLYQKGETIDDYDLDQSVAIQLNRDLLGSSHFKDQRSIKSAEASLLRTSFIYIANQIIGSGDIYAPTEELERLAQLVNLQEMLGEL
jgi:hypothetical protein